MEINNMTPYKSIGINAHILEFIEADELTREMFAERMEMPINEINDLLDGNMKVNQNIALKLSKVFETSIEFWLNLNKESESTSPSLPKLKPSAQYVPAWA